jgi:hypothetical protein
MSNLGGSGVGVGIRVGVGVGVAVFLAKARFDHEKPELVEPSVAKAKTTKNNKTSNFRMGKIS